MVSRLGLAQGYGVPAASIEKAFHEYGVNYLYVSPLLNLGSMVEAVRSLAPGHRDELVIVLAKAFFHPGFGGFRLESFVEKWLSKLGIEWTDLLLQALVPVYRALEIEWRPVTTGSLEDIRPGTAAADVIAVLTEELRLRYELTRDRIDAGMVVAARELAPSYLPF